MAANSNVVPVEGYYHLSKPNGAKTLTYKHSRPYQPFEVPDGYCWLGKGQTVSGYVVVGPKAMPAGKS